jgi:hypothetical protein
MIQDLRNESVLNQLTNQNQLQQSGQVGSDDDKMVIDTQWLLTFINCGVCGVIIN